MKKLLSLVLVILMCFALLPSAVAEGEDDALEQTSDDQSDMIEAVEDHDHEDCDECDQTENSDGFNDESLSEEYELAELFDDNSEDPNATKASLTTPAYITEAEALQRAEYLASKLHKKYFTTTGSTCNSPWASGHGCSKCGMWNVVATTWFKNLIDLTPNTSLSLKHYRPSGAGVTNGQSCVGFANFAGWYINAKKSTDKVTYKSIYVGSETKAALSSAKPGDIIATSGHSRVFISNTSDGTGYKYIDCNVNHGNGNGQIWVGTQKYRTGTTIALNRASNLLADVNLEAYKNYSGKNYLYGSDFSSLDSNYWKSRDTSVSTISIDSSNKHNGYNSLKIVNSSAGSSGKDLQFHTLTQGNVADNQFVGDNKTMILSFWAKSSKSGTKMYFRWGYESTSNYRSVTLSTSWAKYTVRMDKTTAYGRNIHPYINAAGTVWLAEMQLEDGTTATDFVPENGGLHATTTSTYGGNYTMPSNPSRTGYTFDGWYTAVNGGTKITSSTAVKAGHFIVYAHWSKATYTVTFNANGGNISTTSKTVTVGSTYGTLPTPTRSGYTFTGWYTAASGGSQVTSSTTVTTASNHTLYAHWSGPKTYTVTFYALGGTPNSSTKTVTYGSAYGELPTPTWTGHTFDGWYLIPEMESYGTLVTSSTIVTTDSDHALYAQWSTAKYTVTFNANGGSVSTSSKSVTYGSTYGTLPTPTRTGYSFDGWYTASSGGSKITSSTTVTTASNHTLYAHWKLNVVEFDGTVEWNDEILNYKGSTPYVIYNGSAFTPRFTVKDGSGNVISASNYDYVYKENTKAGTGYVIVTLKNGYSGTAQGTFKIYLPPTTATTVANVNDGVKITWKAVPDAAGYVIYRRAWNLSSSGWTTFERWNNTTATTWTDTKVYAGTRYQYGVKAYFAQRTDPVSGAVIGGAMDNYNLGIVGPLKTTVRITTRTLNSVTGGTKQITVKWSGSSVFTGYQVQIATDSAFTQNKKTVTISDAKTVQTTIKNLKAKTTYYVRVRSYHVFEGTTYYGGWSNVLSAETK